MADITQWIKSELFSALFDDLDTIFPELELSRKRDSKKVKWISPLYLSGDRDARPDKTWVSPQTPWLLHEQGEPRGKSLFDIYKEHNNLTFAEALRALSKMARVEPPQSQEWDIERWKQDKHKQGLRQTAQAYFTWCLFNAQGKAQEALNYLKEGRGYTEAEIEQMGLGFIPSQEKLKEHLIKKGYTAEEIANTLHFNGWIGSTHCISIPFVCSGDIVGFDFRQMGSEPIYNKQGAEVGKYQFESDIDTKAERFFNIASLKDDKDLIIVEGELDCLTASVRGIDNVVALGGNTTINEARVKHALKMGAKSFTICLDYDKGKEDNTARIVEAAISTIIKAGCDKIYIASLPELAESPNKTDADTLLKYKGADAFKAVIQEAQVYWSYKLDNIYSYYVKKEEAGGRDTLTEKEVDGLLASLVEVYDSIPSPMDKDRFANGCSGVFNSLGISEDSFKEVSYAFDKAREQQAKSKSLTKTLAEVEALTKAGRIDDAERRLKDGLLRMDEESRVMDFDSLTASDDWDSIKAEAANTPDAIKSGYFFDGIELAFDGGAISVVAAQTNHGKTSVMLNIVNNLYKDERYKGKKWVFLTYEEPRFKLYSYLLNIVADTALNSLQSTNRELLLEYVRKGTKPEFMSAQGFNAIQIVEGQMRKDRLTERIIIKEPFCGGKKMDAEDIAAYIEYLGRRGDIGGVFIDYFQQLKMPSHSSKRSMTRQEELKEICLILNDAAKKSGLPIVLAAQFNREVQNVNMMHPTKIREAADIEQIASSIIGVWNVEQKGLKSKESSSMPTEADKLIDGKARGLYVEVLKSRLMGVGKAVLLDFDGNTSKLYPNTPNSKLYNEDLYS